MILMMMTMIVSIMNRGTLMQVSGHRTYSTLSRHVQLQVHTSSLGGMRGGGGRVGEGV